MKNPKHILYLSICGSIVVSGGIAFLPLYYDYGINYIGLSLHLTFVAVIFFVYSMFLQSKLGENSFFHVWELVQDKFLIGCFLFYFVSLLVNVIISIIKFDITNLSLLWITLYVFINVFSLCLVFCLFIFIMQLINPVKHSYYLISKIGTKKILRYNLASIEKIENGIVLKLNLFSPVIKEEDPLMAVHELMVPSIEKFDYRSVGLIIEKLLAKCEDRPPFRTEKEHIRFAFHLLSYTVRLQRNLNSKHQWNDLGFLRYFSFIYLEFIKKSFHHGNIYMAIMYEVSLMKILEYYYEKFPDQMKGIDFSDHIKLISSIDGFEKNEQLRALSNIFSSEIKNPSLYLHSKINIEGFIHPWV
ncbi:MAG: hypothetical protein CML16_07025 [Pusillimonas sp.]|nr:hypothetical protein [Pusillimonas sp.]